MRSGTGPTLKSVALILGTICCAIAWGASEPELAAGKTEPPKILSIEVKERVNVFAYFPLEVGNTWVYQNTFKSAVGTSTDKIITITWTSEVAVQAHYDVPEGKVVVRKTTNRGVKYDYPEGVKDEDVAWFKKNYPETYPNYLIQGNYVYALPEGSWDAEHKCLSDEFKKRFATGERTPDFFFPMEKVWGWSERKREQKDLKAAALWKAEKGPAPNPAMYYWLVEDKEAVTVPYGSVKGAFRLIERGAGGGLQVWFKYGLGVVREYFKHNGSYYEKESVLKGFIKAGMKGAQK